MKKRILIILLLFLMGCAQVDKAQVDKLDELVVHAAAQELDHTLDDEKVGAESNSNHERGTCSEPITFSHPPVNLEQIDWIVPLGSMSGNHVTPVDHQYYQAFHNNQIEVINPGDGVVTMIERMIDGKDNDWRLIIRHSCSIESIYIHIDKLSDKLMKYVPTTQRSSRPQVDVRAGEIIGWYDNNVDYNVVDYDVEIGLINKESFTNAEEWKIHVQDPFLYFEPKIQKRMIELSLRDEEPYGGKIDYDIDGKLIGMWFQEGTNGYAGVNFHSADYHQGHLAVAPNHIDPSYTIVSLGTYGDDTSGRQFGVGNIDASLIGVGEKVKWELHDYQYESNGVIQHSWGVPRGSTVVNGQGVRGVVMFELIEPRKLKMQVFPGKTNIEVHDFTDATFYVR